MEELLNIEWSEIAALQLDKFYNYILFEWTSREAEKFLDQVQEFELIVSKYPLAFIQSKRKKQYRIGLVHRNVSAIYQIKANKIVIIALIDNRSSKKVRQ